MSTDSNVNNAKREITRFECNGHTWKTFILETGNVTPIDYASIPTEPDNSLPAKPDTADRLLSMVPDMVDKFSKRKKEDAEETAE